MDKNSIANSFRELQDHICVALEKVDGKALFQQDLWEREEGGGGRTRTLIDGNIIEKGGVAFSEVHGPVSNVMKKQLQLDGEVFFATGVSIVLHAASPHIPIIHMNVRYFELDNGKSYWFGGGIDLTPHYIDTSLAGDFHRALKEVCDQYNPAFYPKFKVWADDYFFNVHRNETRGVGGIFFDHLSAVEAGISKDQLLEFCIALGELFPILYKHQVDAGKELPVKESHSAWQSIRRGRYVEFNLVHDRGTKFGLLSGGRTESILMSLPPMAKWEYGQVLEDHSQESESLRLLKKDIDWVSF
ncbi:MAG: oxygen-dependent coproporphyrinogen oxidase [Bacteroidota bacterium]